MCDIKGLSPGCAAQQLELWPLPWRVLGLFPGQEHVPRFWVPSLECEEVGNQWMYLSHIDVFSLSPTPFIPSTLCKKEGDGGEMGQSHWRGDVGILGVRHRADEIGQTGQSAIIARRQRGRNWRLKENYAGTKCPVEMPEQGLSNHQLSNWKKERWVLGKRNTGNQGEE